MTFVDFLYPVSGRDHVEKVSHNFKRRMGREYKCLVGTVSLFESLLASLPNPQIQSSLLEYEKLH